jgi:hypothetical protein
MMLILLMAPAATIALIIFSSILLPREHLALFRNNDAAVITMTADQHLDHIGHTPVFLVRSLAHGFQPRARLLSRRDRF